MKIKIILLVVLLLSTLLSGCAQEENAQIAATTLPVYQFTVRLCENTGITVTRLINESVSCLHDYSLNVSQVRALEAAEVVVISGAGLEDFLEDILPDHGKIIDSSKDIPLLGCEEHADHDHEHDHEHDHGHDHSTDAHIWLSPANASSMAENICQELSVRYPEHKAQLQANLVSLQSELAILQAYGEEQLSGLSCRELVTFHDGFSYFAEAFGLTILHAIEEESGSEASAQELKQLTGIVREHNLPGVFTEVNGSASAADIIAAETKTRVYTLDMAMAGDNYFDAMYHNIQTIKEAME
ncbi:MAG: zinc ABC transporter substrate-binding protein [Oscillospiraceae bacterium]|nr:zinc ABC transporter substrate-binding protein [Oscillospiraceae bacterium]